MHQRRRNKNNFLTYHFKKFTFNLLFLDNLFISQFYPNQKSPLWLFIAPQSAGATWRDTNRFQQAVHHEFLFQLIFLSPKHKSYRHA